MRSAARRGTGTSRSTDGSFGRPSTRSPMMLRWISSVPPAIDWRRHRHEDLGDHAVEQAVGAGRASPTAPAIERVRRAPRVARRRWRRACRASPPGRAGGRRPGPPGPAAPSTRAPADGRTTAAMLLADDRVAGCGPVAAATSPHEVGPAGPLRVPRVGREVLVGLGRASADAPARRPAVDAAPAHRREAAARGRASSGRPASRRRARRRRWSPGTRASVRNTSLNEACPFIWRSGRTSTPGWCIGSTK